MSRGTAWAIWSALCLAAGVLCGVNIDDCEKNPCQNGATCVDGIAGYICICPEPEPGGLTWGGKNCSVSLEGCLQHDCQNEALCSPTYDGETHGFICICQPGFYGENCSISTTFSFTSSGYILYEVDINSGGNTSIEENISQMAVSFRTTLPNMVLLYCGNEENYLILEIYNGLLHVKLKHSSYLDIGNHRVNDGHWHSARVHLHVDRSLSVYLNGSFSKSYPINAWNDSQLPDSFNTVYIGGITQDILLNNTLSKQNFTGCMQDTVINNKTLLPQKIKSDRMFEMTLGCQKRDWCTLNPCHHEGLCIDQWTSYRCECARPYTGPSCLQEYMSGTFFRDNVPSFANFTITQHIGDTFNISAFIRTLKPDGLLLQLSNSTTDHLTIYLKSRQMHIATVSGKTLSFKEDISNGKKHMINISIKEQQVTVNDIKLKEDLGPLWVSAENTAFVGGLSSGSDIEQWGGYFKGCLQDLRINEQHLEFIPSANESIAVLYGSVSNITAGCMSDDVCQSSPCRNDGTCTVTWNDFTCNCSANFTGPTCEEPVWCQRNPCPPETICQDMPGGYTCLSYATFKKQSFVLFTPNISSDVEISSLSLDFRTRDYDAVLLKASGDLDYLSIIIQGGYLLFTMETSGDQLESVHFDTKVKVSDALWHKLDIFANYSTVVPSQWTMSLDNGQNSTQHGNTGSLNFLAMNRTLITLAKNYTGCLGQVAIGGLVLPFADQYPQQFIRRQANSMELGCRGTDVCKDSLCQHGGRCLDLFNDFRCACAGGRTGRFCESEICFHGNYTDSETEHPCNCFSGYTGRRCESNVDDCQKHRCLNGGSCLDGTDSYTCICPATYTGFYCEVPLPSDQCGKGFPCLNGGKCISSSWGANCTCRPGFKGKRCEININECEPNPCYNGGSCQDLVNNFKCICNTSFIGVRCEKPRLIKEAKASTQLLGSAIGTGMLFILLLVITIIMLTMRKKRATQGAYSPSRQEKEGARVEMWNVLKLPPTERLI